MGVSSGLVREQKRKRERKYINPKIAWKQKYFAVSSLDLHVHAEKEVEPKPVNLGAQVPIPTDGRGGLAVSGLGQ